MHKEFKFLGCAFSGESNSGKTTLIEKISTILSKEFKVCIIKHDPKDKSAFDTEGKDSYRFYESGADVAVISPKKSAIFLHGEKDIFDIVKKFEEFDYLLVEGLKYIALPRVTIFRESINNDYFGVSNAFAISEEIDREKLPKDMDILNINSPADVISWINKNGIYLKGKICK